MLDYGYAEFDVRHKADLRRHLGAADRPRRTGAKRTFLGGWQLNWIFTARSGYPFTVYDCTNGLALCMRAIDTGGINKNATSGPATGEPERVHPARPHADRSGRRAAT